MDSTFIFRLILFLLIGCLIGYLWAKYLNEKAKNKILSDEIRRLESKDKKPKEAKTETKYTLTPHK